MPIIRTQVVQPLYGSASGRHVATTSYWFVPGLAPLDEYEEIAQRLTAAYAEIATYRSQLATPARVLMYDLGDPEPRLPVYDEPLTAGMNNSAGTMPGQIAVVLSYRGPYTSGIARARRRGRMYLGPIHSSAAATSSTSAPVLLSEAAQGKFLDFATALSTAVENASVIWVQWSETDQLPAGVVEASVDRAFDIQRSRQADGTRLSEEISQPPFVP